MLPSASPYSVGIPKWISYAAEYPARSFPLSTLRRHPREWLRMTRGRCGSLILQRMNLAFTTPRRFSRRTRRSIMSVDSPSPEHILQVGLGFWPSKTLLSAVEMGLFTELAKRPED